MKELILIGAYDRHYKKRHDLMEDWEGGKVFKVINGPYCTIRDSDVILSKFEAILGIVDDGELCLIKANKGVNTKKMLKGIFFIPN